MSKLKPIWRYKGRLLALACALALLFAATSTSPAIWPLRNTLFYRVDQWLGAHRSAAPPAGHGSLAGCLRSSAGAPIAGGQVMLSEPDGRLHLARGDAAGCYRLDQLPAGSYVPVASASGYQDQASYAWGFPLSIAAGQTRQLDLTLEPEGGAAYAPGAELVVGAPVEVRASLPQPALAYRRTLSYDSGGRPSQLTFLYTPEVESVLLPTLLAVYPGPADQWEGVSVELAAAGYSVVAVGPEYSFRLDDDVAELQRLVGFVRAGALSQADGRTIALLGGSYSSLHIQRLLRYDAGFRAVVLLGPITDLFDLRRRFEEGSFFPPFGLDQALIALGWPHREAERYLRYSALYHLRPDLPPLLLMHSRDDEVIPFQQSESLQCELTRLGIAHESHFFDGMSHYLNTGQASPELDQLYALTLDFLARALAAPPASA